MQYNNNLNNNKMFDWKKPTVQMLGRWQPWHECRDAIFGDAKTVERPETLDSIATSDGTRVRDKNCHASD